MRLLITDPAQIVADHPDVDAVRAEDATGSFGILKGHSDFLTALEISVVSWRHADGRQGFCAIRQGILTVSGGRDVRVATREAHIGDDLDTLERDVLARYRERIDADRTDRETRLTKAVRVRADRRKAWARDGAPSLARNLGQIGALGWTITVPILICLAAGRWLDHHFASGVFWTAPLIMIGAVFGGWSAWRWINRR